MQVRLPGVLVHMAFVEQPPFMVAHSSTSVEQVVPVQPFEHTQVNVPGPLIMQVPPLRHGLVGRQALTAVQVSPSPE